MAKTRGRTSGLITSIASLILVAGAALLSISEGNVSLNPTSVPYPTLPVYDYSFPETATFFPESPAELQFTLTPSQFYSCTPPTGWLPYRVLAGDTLQSLTLTFPATIAEIVAANCLVVDTLPPNSIIYLPPTAMTVTLTATQSQSVCGPPEGWVPYRVQLYDNLFSISLMFGVSVPELQIANCMGSSTTIYVGDYLMVPNLPTLTFTSTHTLTATFIYLTPQPTNTSTTAPTQTDTIVTSPSFTPTPSPTTVPTESPTVSPTTPNTETPTASPTTNPVITPSG